MTNNSDLYSVTIRDEIAFIKFEKLNNATSLFEFLCDRIAGIAADINIKVLVIILPPDIEENEIIFDDEQQRIHNLNAKNNYLEIIDNLTIPSIAVLTGNCQGQAFNIACVCTIRLATENAIVKFPQEDSLLLAGIPAGNRITKLIKKNETGKDIQLFGNSFSAPQLARIHFFNKIFPEQNVEDSVYSFALHLIRDRDITVIHSILKCMNSYKNHPSLLEGEFSLEEESKQFCYLIERGYRNRSVK